MNPTRWGNVGVVNMSGAREREPIALRSTSVKLPCLVSSGRHRVPGVEASSVVALRRVRGARAIASRSGLKWVPR